MRVWVGRPIVAAAAFLGGSSPTRMQKRPDESRLRARLPAPQAPINSLVSGTGNRRADLEGTSWTM